MWAVCEEEWCNLSKTKITSFKGITFDRLRYVRYETRMIEDDLTRPVELARLNANRRRVPCLPGEQWRPKWRW